MRWQRAGIWLAILGATVGSALDGIHTWTGTTWYPHPVFLRTAAWTPLIFAAAGLMGLGRPAI
jgi:hypothetical protein